MYIVDTHFRNIKTSIFKVKIVVFAESLIFRKTNKKSTIHYWLRYSELPGISVQNTYIF